MNIQVRAILFYSEWIPLSPIGLLLLVVFLLVPDLVYAPSICCVMKPALPDTVLTMTPLDDVHDDCPLLEVGIL